MKRVLATAVLAAMSAAGLVVSGCQNNNKAPEAKDKVVNALKQGGYDDINVDEDRDKGVVTLKGSVKSDADKAKAEDLAKANAGTEVVSNQLLVEGGDAGQAKKVAGATDDAIEARWKEWVDANRMGNQHIHADAKNGVLTLTGDVDTAGQRAAAEKAAAKIDGVTQVVNELTIKGAKHRRQAAGE
jgi:hyperosmotically inducible periplasmic protein